MASLLRFYAVEADLRDIFQAVETAVPLKYVVDGAFRDPEPPSYPSIMDVPGLGRLTRKQTVSLPKYIVATQDVIVTTEAVPQLRGGVMHFVRAPSEGAWALFRAGGVFEDKGVLPSELGWGFGASVGRPFYRDLTRRVTRTFLRVRDIFGEVFVGPAAVPLLRRGLRFTSNFTNPGRADLPRDAGRLPSEEPGPAPDCDGA